MAYFTVNGTPVRSETNRKLLDFLRDDLLLTGTKNGCSEGTCGACTVLVNGAAKRACTLTTDRLAGASVVTIEGLSEREKAVYGYAFAKCGAVQCGFCTPGMVMSAKGLLDAVPDPTEQQVRAAIRGNVCRCTGYVKIVEAILLAGRLLREGAPVPKPDEGACIGGGMPRPDAVPKALGEAKYADDLHLPGMVYASCVRPPFARCRVVSLDTREAVKHPGVIAVFTAADIPGNKKIGHLTKDYDVLIPVGHVTHFIGDAIALVVADTEAALEEGKQLVKAEYEELPGVFSAEEAMWPESVRVHGSTHNRFSHEHIIRGNAEKAIRESAYKVTNTYVTPFTEHAFLEPECAVAEPEGEGVHVYSGDQGIYQTQRECAEMLGIEPEAVRVTAMAVGGGFGGKEDMSVQHHAALAAYLTRLPVKVRLTRAESIRIHPKRHPMEITMTTSCDENGKLTGMVAAIIADTGAYASLGRPVLQRACTLVAGPYNYQNSHIEGFAYYTNNPPAGAFRGFGVAQSCFAAECNINMLAGMVGISPFEMRLRNAIRPGDVLPNGQIADDSTALVETLEAVRPVFERDPKAGIACAMKNSGLGVGVPDTGRCRIVVKDGIAHLYSSAARIGQGMASVQVRCCAEITGLPAEKIRCEAPDTALSPDSGNTTASRQTVFTGEAVRQAAAELKEALNEAGSLDALEGAEFWGEFTYSTDPLNSVKKHPVSHVAYGYATHAVELNEDGTVKRVTAAHDAGTVIDPVSIEGQIEGGVTMSLGYALTEDFPLERGVPQRKFGTLGLFRADRTPEIVAVTVGKGNRSGIAYGAKGIGEICSIPTAPAVQNAYFNRDGIFRRSLPLEGTPYSRKK